MRRIAQVERDKSDQAQIDCWIDTEKGRTADGLQVTDARIAPLRRGCSTSTRCCTVDGLERLVRGL